MITNNKIKNKKIIKMKKTNKMKIKMKKTNKMIKKVIIIKSKIKNAIPLVQKENKLIIKILHPIIIINLHIRKREIMILPFTACTQIKDKSTDMEFRIFNQPAHLCIAYNVLVFQRHIDSNINRRALKINPIINL